MSTDRAVITLLDLGFGGGGALIIERALARTSGVVRVHVNSATEMAYVEYDPSVIKPCDLRQVVEAAGFAAEEPLLR